MTATLLFVHGTGVRADGVERAAERFRHVFNPARVVAPTWAQDHGIPLDTDFSLSLPPGQRGAAAFGVPDVLDGPVEFTDAVRMALLIDDPLAELRVVAADADAGGGPGLDLPAPGGRADPLEDRLRTAAERVDLNETGLDTDDLLAGVDRLLEDEATRTVAEMDDGMPLLVDALLAAGIAEALRHTTADAIPAATSAEVRDRIILDLDREVGVTRGIGGWVAGKLVRQSADVLRRHVTPPIARFVADILMYYTKREAVLADLRDLLDRLTDGGTQVVVLAHSLGGIAMVDLFREPDPPIVGVRALVTAGTQASAVQLMGTTDRPKSLPLPWLNFYDPADILAFYASTVFPGAVDRKVTSGSVNAHSAYWESDVLQGEVRRLLG